MAAWVACALAALVILKPQEFIGALAGLPLLYVAFAGVLVAAAIDRIRGKLRITIAPHVPFVLAFFAWALVVTAVKRPSALEAQAFSFAVVLGLFAAIAVGTATAAGLRALAITLASCAAIVTVVAVVQSQRPLGCFLAAPDDWEGRGELVFDGRPCETVLDCRKDAPQPDGNYRCERRGPLETATIGGRVRYRGSLADPNELCLAIAMFLPFAFALAKPARAPATRTRPFIELPPLLGDALITRAIKVIRALPAALLLGLEGAAVVLSQSRSGLLVFLTVLGIQAIRRLGAWGIVAACIFGPPLALLGGRGGTEAEESADERVEILREAFEMIRGTKGFGLGAGQFADESSLGLTAHNAYVLAAAETGIVGLVLFSLMLYLAIKAPVVIWLDGRSRAARFAPAVAVSIAGALVGILFLSWTYKDVLYLVLGASAALCSAAHAEGDRVRVRLSFKEVALVSAAALGLLFVVYVGSRLHK
jgi:O-antigen ligase